MIFGRNKAMIITRAKEVIDEEKFKQFNSSLIDKDMLYFY